MVDIHMSLVAQWCLTLCDPMDCTPQGSSVYGDSSGKNTGVNCHFLLQGIFPAQGLNPGLPQCRWILYHLSHLGSPQGRAIRENRQTDRQTDTRTHTHTMDYYNEILSFATTWMDMDLGLVKQIRQRKTNTVFSLICKT